MWSQIKDAGGCWYTTYGGLGIFNHARGYFGRVTTLPMARLRCWVLCWRLGENEAPSVSHTVCGNCWVMGENRHKNLSTTFQSEEDKWHDFPRYQCCKISCASFMKQNNGSSRVFFRHRCLTSISCLPARCKRRRWPIWRLDWWPLGAQKLLSWERSHIP